MLAAIDNLNDSVTELKNSARSSKSKNQEKNKVMHNNKNLVGVHAKKPNLYVRALMKILFTHEERKGGIIVENSTDSRRSTARGSDRIALDKDRVNKLKGILYKFIFELKNKTNLIYIFLKKPRYLKNIVFLRIKKKKYGMK